MAFGRGTVYSARLLHLSRTRRKELEREVKAGMPLESSEIQSAVNRPEYLHASAESKFRRRWELFFVVVPGSNAR